ncbi:hypothetical protein GPJ56_002952 [Histomonas meleagridis]|uniref:uncharacterized protein n=1 Tax=Histomonas meleagridis TaxID=135588 RepID=UPI003559AA71|nr:hypothetical protein GPJ56_002952 [Histomonas meleagridis]KAH0796611.1 hypothetical protein GO595_010504 [Histomonas meleagridis]
MNFLLSLFLIYLNHILSDESQKSSYLSYASELSEDVYTISFPNFDKWEDQGSGGTIDSSGQVVTVSPGTSTSDCYKFCATITSEDIPNNKKYAYARTVCNAHSSNKNTGAQCYVDMTRTRNIQPRVIYQYGANSNIGTSTVYELSQPCPNISVDYCIYLENDADDDRDAVFTLPVIELFNTIVESKEIETTTETIKPNVKRVKGHVPYNSQDPKLHLYTLKLTNPHPFPDTFSSPNFNYISTSKNVHQVPILANSTHIIGIDIFARDFVHLWEVETSYDSTDMDSQLLCFSMYIEVIDRNGFDMPYIILEKPSTSWLDALEKWHLTFPEIYNEQPGGQGLWAAFPDLVSIFPDSTEDRDIFGVQFLWGPAYDEVKPYLSTYLYIEPSLIHVTIPYTPETYIQDLESCAADTSNEEHLACEALLENGNQYPYGQLNAREENAGWNVGSVGYVSYTGKAYEYLTSDLNKTISTYKKHETEYHGIAVDSFSSGFRIDYATDTHTPAKADIIPYYLVDSDNGHSYVPNIVHYFTLYKDHLSDTPRGFMTNTNYEPPQFTQFHACSGHEVEIVGDSHHVEYTSYFRENFWKQRYVLGSRPMSQIENTDRKYALRYMEEYFSLLISFGCAPSYFSHDASSESFFTLESIDDINTAKPQYERWTPIFRTLLNDTVYYANQRGMVTMELPADEQNPELTDEEELNAMSMFCEKEDKAVDGFVNCYVAALIANSGTYSGDDFKRTLVLNVNTTQQLNCLFVSNDMSCDAGNGKVTLKIEGLPKYQRYRAAVISFKASDSYEEAASGSTQYTGGSTQQTGGSTGEQGPDQSSMNESDEYSGDDGDGDDGSGLSPGAVAGIVIAVVVVAIVIAVSIIIVLRKNKKADSEPSL